MVPLSWSWLTPCSSPATTKQASTGSTAPFIVIDTRHLLEGDAVEEDLHVLDRVDGHAGLADVAHDPGVVGVVAAVGGEVEGHRHALLAGGQVAPVEGVALLGGGEAGVLADRPRPAGVHRGPRRRARTGRSPGSAAEVLDAVEVVLGVERLDGDALGGVPDRACRGRRPSGPCRRAPASRPRGSVPGVSHGVEVTAGPATQQNRRRDGVSLPLRGRRGRGRRRRASSTASRRRCRRAASPAWSVARGAASPRCCACATGWRSPPPASCASGATTC